MASRLNEVQASMDTVVNDLAPINAILLFQIRVEARLDVLYNGSPTEKHESVYQNAACKRVAKTALPVIIVDKITKAGGINDGQV